MKRRRLASEINVVPYIDVMLVLLIIFMITAPLLKAGVEVDLPDAQAQPLQISEDNEPLILTIQAGGAMFLNIGPHPHQPVDAAAIRKYASIALRKQPRRPVVVRGDTSVAYGAVVQGMVLLQQSGATQVGLVTDNQSDVGH